MVGERAQPEVIEKIRKELGTDRNLVSQYYGYIKLLLQGEFGRSYYTNRKVFDDLLLKFPNTLKLAVCAMLIAIPLGLSFGFLSAYKKDTWMDGFISAISVTGLSVPGLLERASDYALPEPSAQTFSAVRHRGYTVPHIAFDDPFTPCHCRNFKGDKDLFDGNL